MYTFEVNVQIRGGVMSEDIVRWENVAASNHCVA
jgi:hypothetical protein